MFTGCDKDEDDNPTPQPQSNIVEFATANGFSSLVAAVQAADPAIAAALTGTTDLTVFAPTNEAFQALLDSNSDWNALSDIGCPLSTRPFIE